MQIAPFKLEQYFAKHEFTAKYTDYIHIDEIFCMFDEEFEELKQWYDLDVFIRYVINNKQFTFNWNNT